MANKDIFISQSPKKGKTPRSSFDLTFTNNLTSRFGRVQVAMFKYAPPGTKMRIKPYLAFDMMPLVYPVQSNIRCHLKLYKVPLRILCKDFEDFCCQLGSDGLPVNSGGSQIVLPYIKRASGWNPVGSLAEQLNCSNLKFSDVTRFLRLGTQKFPYAGGSSDTFWALPSSSGYNSICIISQLPPATSVTTSTQSTYENCTGLFYYVDQNSSVPASTLNGSFIAFVGRRVTQNGQTGDFYDPNDKVFRTFASSTVGARVSSIAAFNSSTVSCYHIGSSQAVTINGATYYRHPVYFKVVDDNFYNISAGMVTTGYPQYFGIRCVSTSNISPLFYTPFQDTSNINAVSFVSYRYSKTESNGDISSTSQTSTFESSLGLNNLLCVSALQVEESTHTKYDSVEGAEPVEPISALPFRALEFIHNYFQRNYRVSPFVKDGVVRYNEFITNDGSGADETTPVDFWNALYEDDMFTTCVKEPQFGNAPLVGVTVNDLGDTGILTFSDGDNPANDYTVELNLDQDGNVLPLTAYKDIADRPNVHRLQELIKYGISINDLRNVTTFQRMLERMQRSVLATGNGKSPFGNYMYEFFGTNPPIGDHYPQYLGGLTRNISVDKITNVAKSQGNQLGEFAGQGKFRGDGKTIKVFCSEPCYIIGLYYFTVTPVYPQYLPKLLTYKHPLDFYLNPEFAFVGPQPVYKKQIACGQLSAEEQDDVFGYNRPYVELFQNVDEVHGNFKTDMSNYLLQRVFGSAPNLNESFIEVRSDDLLNIFSVVENTDKLFGQVMFKITGSLPAPRSYLPRSI